MCECKQETQWCEGTDRRHLFNMSHQSITPYSVALLSIANEGKNHFEFILFQYILKTCETTPPFLTRGVAFSLPEEKHSHQD